jgi:hypothetical protein
VGAVVVVVREVLGEHYSKVAFAVNEEVVGALAAQGANPTLADRVRPGRLDRSFDDLGAFGVEDDVEAGGVFSVAVSDQKPERPVEVHEQVPGLLGDPWASRVLGEAEEVHASGGVFDAEEHVDALEQNGVEVQEVDGENAVGLIEEELAPG